MTDPLHHMGSHPRGPIFSVHLTTNEDMTTTTRRTATRTSAAKATAPVQNFSIWTDVGVLFTSEKGTITLAIEPEFLAMLGIETTRPELQPTCKLIIRAEAMSKRGNPFRGVALVEEYDEDPNA